MFFGSRLNRLATSIRRGISKYSVGSDNPGLVFDFIDNFYQKDKNQTVNFDGAINHARSGNAVMTDGYGPELVVNGGFDSDLSGWTDTNSHWSVVDGRAYHASSSAYNPLSLTLSLSGTYILTFDAEVISASNTAHLLVDGTSTQLLANGSDSYSVFITDATTIVFSREPGSTAEFYIDNVSVREMPVIKWAPHNLFSYSEQLDNSYWQKTLVTVSANSTVAPNGTTTADKLIPTVVNNSHYIGNVISYPVAGETYELCVFAKPAGYNFIKLFGANSGTSEAWFDISNGTKGTTGGTGFVSSSITDVGNGWYRCALKFINPDATARNTGYYVINADNVNSFAGDGTSGIHFWGAHLYKTDLGGMVDNPDRGDSYVPTTSSAKYLPRVGHHVYNGSAWVNEGLLAESEARVNLVTDSSLGGWSTNGAVITTNSAVSPSGQEDAVYARDNVFNGSHYIYEQTSGPNGTWTFSVYIKEADSGMYAQLRPYGLGTGVAYATFDPADGSVYESGGTNLDQTTSEDVGNGWYRVSITCSEPLVSGDGPMVALTDGTAGELPSYVGANEGVYLYGAQVEQASTPSSLIPTSGSTVSRAAETFTIPSANLPWPTPQYIGDELVTNGDGSSTTNWSAARSNSTLTVTGGRLRATATTAGAYGPVQTLTNLTIGNVYQAKADVFTGGGSGSFYFRLVASSTLVGSDPVGIGVTSDTSVSVEFVATATTMYVGVIHVASAGGDYVELDNVSVREINPLSVSIAMDGRMTYADTGASVTVNPYRWQNDGNNLIRAYIDTAGSLVGRVAVQQNSAGVGDYSSFASGPYVNGVLTPFDIAARHGSTFIQGAASGESMAVNTTPTSLPDLSAININLAHAYMGTIGTFRIWDKDLGDTGLVEATNPSLEPSLSLTFEGVGTNSFTVSDWSE